MIEQNNPLAQLKGIHLPEPVFDLPIAVGWWVLLIVGVFSLLLIVKLINYIIKKNAYRRLAIQLLTQIELDFAEHKNDFRLVSSINQLLKSVAITRFPDQHCEPMHGESWIHFLKLSVNKSKSVDFNAFAHFSSLYQAEISLSKEQRHSLLLNAKKWLKNHRKIISGDSNV